MSVNHTPWPLIISPFKISQKPLCPGDGTKTTVTYNGTNNTVPSDETKTTITYKGTKTTVSCDGTKTTVPYDGINTTANCDRTNTIVPCDGKNHCALWRNNKHQRALWRNKNTVSVSITMSVLKHCPTETDSFPYYHYKAGMTCLQDNRAEWSEFYV